jgi:glycosyltransferase involved in cell wall biosynthesis
MKPVRVACYYPWIYLRSGAERTILETVLRSKHEWTIYTNHYDRAGTYPEFSSLNVVELDRISVDRGFGSVLRGALTLIKQRLPMQTYDVLFVHSEGLGDLITFKNNTKPIVCYCHSPLLVANDDTYQKRYTHRNPHKAVMMYLFGHAFRIVDRYAWKHYQHIFVTSKTVAELVVKGGLAKRERLRILPPGVDCHSVVPSDHREPFFLAFSRLKWTKNVELSINAFRLASQNGWVPGFRLIIAGQVDAGSKNYFQELIALAEGCPEIEFIPNPSADQVHELYAKCYSVLNCTRREPWGMVPLEANAYGKPVIAVDQGGTTESQVHGITGLLASPTAAGFASALGTLARNPELVEKMGKAARANVLKYDWSEYVLKLDKFIDATYTFRGAETQHDDECCKGG